MKKKKLNTIHLNDSNKTIITTFLSEKEFLNRLENNRFSPSRVPLNFDYLNTIITA